MSFSCIHSSKKLTVHSINVCVCGNFIRRILSTARNTAFHFQSVSAIIRAHWLFNLLLLLLNSFRFILSLSIFISEYYKQTYYFRFVRHFFSHTIPKPKVIALCFQEISDHFFSLFYPTDDYENVRYRNMIRIPTIFYHNE